MSLQPESPITLRDKVCQEIKDRNLQLRSEIDTQSRWELEAQRGLPQRDGWSDPRLDVSWGTTGLPSQTSLPRAHQALERVTLLSSPHPPLYAEPLGDHAALAYGRWGGSVSHARTSPGTARTKVEARVSSVWRPQPS